MGSERRIRAAESKVRWLEGELSKSDSEILRAKKDLEEEEKDLNAEIENYEYARSYAGKNDQRIEWLKEEVVCQDHIIDIYKEIIKKIEGFPDQKRVSPMWTIEDLKRKLDSAGRIKMHIANMIMIEEECQSDEYNAPKIESSAKVVQSTKTSLESSKKALDSSIRYRDTIAAKLENARKELASAIADRDAKMR